MLREYFSGNNKFIADYSWIDFFVHFGIQGIGMVVTVRQFYLCCGILEI